MSKFVPLQVKHAHQKGARSRETTRRIFCCGCVDEVNAKLVTGAKIYPHRPDLRNLPFWECPVCRNFVGCHHRHHDARKRTDPLGCIATQEVKEARKRIHAELDPLWRSGQMGRREVYKRLARAMGCDEYHTAEIRSVEEAGEVLRAVQAIAAEAVA